jgi:hypothetical protein
MIRSMKAPPRCFRCGRLLEHAGSTCDRCTGVTARVIRARDAPGMRELHRFPVAKEFDLGRASIAVLDLHTFTTYFVLRYAVFPPDAGGVPQDDLDRLHLGLWEATDDVGHHHAGIGGEAEGSTGDRWTWTGTVLLAPGLAADAHSLDVRFRSPTGDAWETVTFPIARAAGR